MKKEYILLAVIFVLLLLYLAFHQSDNIHYQLPEISKIQPKTISKIEITKDADKITLTRKDDKWMIMPEQYPADSGMVNQILDIVGNLSVTALVSESENYLRYELDEKNRIHVRAFAGDDIKREFYIGKTAPSFNHTFIRLEKDPGVYHAGENFRAKFDQTADNLRDKTALSFNMNDIQEVMIEKEKRQMAFMKKQIPAGINTSKAKTPDSKELSPETKPVWQDASGNTIEDLKINSFLSILSGLRCKNYPANKNKEDLKNPIFTAKLKGIKEYSISIFAAEKNKEEYPAASSQNDYPFTIEKTTADSILTIFDKKEEKKP
ncbi:MAG: DUF4340 domain-containing protein [Deltaproteobacteria bacterium]|nr:MAG: DUF4340 domain-containing protein [Deltaproteobacteria bacterium]